MEDELQKTERAFKNQVSIALQLRNSLVSNVDCDSGYYGDSLNVIRCVASFRLLLMRRKLTITG